jgi:hypothetical protein
MDVIGRKPTSEAGKYFRNNVWWWRPLADYVCEVAPEITAKCQHWQTNDGDGLNATDSKRLAAVLKQKIAEGHTLAHAQIRAAELLALPDERCTICGGTGYRAEPPECGPGSMPCNGCEAKGRRRPSDTYYPFEVSNVEEFIVFLEACGGFKIN